MSLTSTPAVLSRRSPGLSLEPTTVRRPVRPCGVLRGSGRGLSLRNRSVLYGRQSDESHVEQADFALPACGSGATSWLTWILFNEELSRTAYSPRPVFPECHPGLCPPNFVRLSRAEGPFIRERRRIQRPSSGPCGPLRVGAPLSIYSPRRPYSGLVTCRAVSPSERFNTTVSLFELLSQPPLGPLSFQFLVPDRIGLASFQESPGRNSVLPGLIFLRPAYSAR